MVKGAEGRQLKKAWEYNGLGDSDARPCLAISQAASSVGKKRRPNEKANAGTVGAEPIDPSGGGQDLISRKIDTADVCGGLAKQIVLFGCWWRGLGSPTRPQRPSGSSCCRASCCRAGNCSPTGHRR